MISSAGVWIGVSATDGLGRGITRIEWQMKGFLFASKRKLLKRLKIAMRYGSIAIFFMKWKGDKQALCQ